MSDEDLQLKLEEKLVFLQDGTAAKQTTYLTTKTYRVIDEETNESFYVKVPRKDLKLTAETGL